MNEMQLIAAAQRGDDQAFAQLMERYQQMVYVISFRILRHPEDAADATQDTFIKLYRNLSAYRHDGKFSTYLGRIATNVCLDKLRQERRRRIVSLSGSDDEDSPELQIMDTSWQVDPELQAENAELRRALLQAINSLDDEWREIIILRELQGLSYTEISEKLDIGLGTVKSRLSRARGKILDELRKTPELLPLLMRQNIQEEVRK